MPELERHMFPVLPDTVSFHLKNPFSKEVRTVRRTQLPLVPAFAMTAHRAQGQTLDRVIVDLASCKGAEAPYVMLSRASSLDGLAILRPFDIERIRVGKSQDHQLEQHRLRIVELLTLRENGDAADRQMASTSLREYPESETRAVYSGDTNASAGDVFSVLQTSQAWLEGSYLGTTVRPRIQKAVIENEAKRLNDEADTDLVSSRKRRRL
ncbi:hypothetical protein H0H92_013979 [Tricholoma furcatifolium]|nr:hypothetical protein H0H92_013979 [Tricholoma furcatifolium]